MMILLQDDDIYYNELGEINDSGNSLQDGEMLNEKGAYIKYRKD